MPGYTPRRPGLRVWFAAARPWSFTAAVVPICFGAALAWLAVLPDARQAGLFLLTLIGGTAMQAATNLHNTYGDYLSGVDTPASAATCPQLVTGSISPGAMYRAGWLVFAFAGIVGGILIALCGLEILPFAIAGVAGGYFYTNGRAPYKYQGRGLYAVFLLMGPLMAAPAYFIQTGGFSPAVFAGSLSISCLVSAIMHANDLRDIEHDHAAGIRTVATRLGRERSIRLFAVLNLGAFVLLALNTAAGILPLPCLLAFILLPSLLRVLCRMRVPGYDAVPLEAWSARYHMRFGMLLTGGLLAALLDTGI
jgi:1,4-dihydroxy-2-naphthoate octaprenyltransferase